MALTASLQRARRNRDLLPSSPLIRYNTQTFWRSTRTNNSGKQGLSLFFQSDANPALGHVLVHSVCKAPILVVTVELMWSLFLNILPFNLVPARNKSLRSRWFRTSYVNHSQMQPSRGVLRKRCSENMQEIYRRTPMPTCDFNKIAIKSHCGMGVILKICCIFSECLFLGTPLSGCLCTLLPFQPTTVKCELFSLLDVWYSKPPRSLFFAAVCPQW